MTLRYCPTVTMHCDYKLESTTTVNMCMCTGATGVICPFAREIPVRAQEDIKRIKSLIALLSRW
jgi:hypothetical protein